VAERFSQHPHAVLMGDRESDLFDLFAMPRPANVDLLVRVCREKRRVEHRTRYLDKALQSEPVRGHVQIGIPARPNRQARRAKMAVRWLSLEVHAPCHGPKRPAVRLNFIVVEELDPPKDEKPVRWLLATTLPVESLEDALQCVQWYAYRWTIERFHFVLKSGCKVEERQLETVDAMERAIPVFSIVAWRLLWLTLQARETPEAPCTIILEEYEWKALCATVHARPRQLRMKPPTLREATRMIAQLGGFLGRKCDGEPGPQTLWRGLRRLHDIAQGWLAAQEQHEVC
jgi:Transposase Tn5 dimerisation domain/Transposase DDE domain